MQKTLKKSISILLSILMIVSLFAVVPITASALTIDDVQSLLSSMEAKINDYNTQGDWDRAGALKDYYDWLDGELEYADGQITPELESAYNEAYEYFMAGVSYPDVNNVYRATNGWVNVTVSDLQPGDVLVTSDTLSVRKGDCDIVLVGGTYCEEDNLSRTYLNNVTLGNNISFLFGGNLARIIDADNAKNYDPVYNNALGNAYMVIGNENGTVYLAGYNFITTYTVTWKNGDTVLKTDTVEEGATPTYDGATPTKAAADGDHMYVFSGWTPELAPVTEDVTYTATFASSADLVEITDHETDLGDLGLDYVMVEWGRSMTDQEAITLAQYMSAQNDGAKCAVLYEVVDDYDLQYAMSDGTTGSRTGFIGYALNDFLPDYKVYYLPVNLNPETIELNLNQDNATVIWYDATDSDGYWSMEAAYNDSCYLVLKGNSNQPAGTYEWADMGSGCGIRDYDASQEIYFVDGSCTVTVDEDVVTVSGTFTGRDRNTYVVTVTYEAPYYTITDESVNGTVTAEVNGADVTKAKAGKTVLLNVAPDEGYQLKSITASAQKTNPEDFSDLVALMGDAVFGGDENYDCGGYTCKVEDGKFVVYNGANLLAELSESNMTGFNGDGDSDYYVDVNSDDVVWSFYVKNGEIAGIDVMDADYDYIFCSLSGSKSTGTLQPVQVDLTTVTEGSQYSFTMPNKPVTVTAEFEAIPTYTVTWKNGDTVLETDTDVAEGTTPTYNGATPYKADGADCIYTFSGWTPEVSAVTGDATYTAQFTESEKPETIKDCTNKYGDFRLYANVPLVQYSDFEDILDGAIIPITYGDSNTMIPLQDAKGYSYKFYDQTGTELPAQITDSSSAPGSNYEFSDDVTVYTNVINFTRPAGCTAIYIVATAPAPELPEVIKDCTYHAPDGQKIFANVPVFDIPDEANKLLSGYIFADVDTSDDEGGMRSIVVEDTKNYSYKLYDKNGNEINATITYSDSYPGTELKDDSNAAKEWFVDFADDDVLYDKGYDLGGSYDTVYIVANAPAPKLFTGHSVTLGGDIGVNFFLNPDVLDTYGGEKTVTFTVDGKETTVDVPATADAKGYMVTCNVVAAQMAHKISAVVYVGNTALDQTDSYSVQDYAETVFKNPAAYDNKGKPDELKALAQALLNYGAMAQIVFDEYLVEKPELANKTVGDNGYAAVTAEQIGDAVKGTSADLNKVAEKLGAEYYTSSLIYLSKNTLRVYFTPTTYPGTIPNADKYAGNLFDYYYYVDHANIPAAELDEQKELTVGDYTFTYTALDYAKAVVNSGMGDDQKNLAKALYLYNQKANAYFDDAPAPVENVVDLGTLQGDYEAQNNDVLTGVLSGDKKISIADGATITLRDANITLSSSAQYAGITPLGDATILLEETNTVKGGNRNYPGIYVPAGKTLIIDGTGSLNASSHGCGCGIGGGFEKAAGNTVINGGTITATGGEFAAGIGSGQYGSCGNITITGGTITANGGDDAAGIGSGDDGSCGNILITGGTVTANGRYTAAGIGSGYEATCGNITIADTVTQVTATKGKYSPNSIGAGDDGTCGTVTIAPGANVIQN